MADASILIVEDEAIVAADLASKLGRLGYLVCGTTAFGEQAIELVRTLGPDLVMMDIRLAGAMDGIEAAAIVRREFGVPVIFLTAHSDRATLQRAKGSDPFGYLLKPFDEFGLETHIEMSLYKHLAERRLLQARIELEQRVEERTRELKEAEQQLRCMNGTLEQRVAERTAELEAANTLLAESRRTALQTMEDALAATRRAEAINRELVRESAERRQAEEELRTAKLKAEEASRAKSQFLANMSHELRTPMTGVLGMLQLALQDVSGPQQQDYLETALKGGQSLLRILNDIIDLTKVESGNLMLEEKPFALKACVMETVDLMIPEARRKGLELRVSLDEGLPEMVVGDQVRLRQVLANLTCNAVKFTAQGEVSVEVALASPPGDGRVGIGFRVRDSGIGIRDDKKHLLFQFFSQVDDSDTRNYGGAGLGLAISRQLVEKMGGEIGFESEQGKGSTFFLAIPFGIEEREPEPEDATVTEAPSSTPLQAPGEVRLLVAEDDATIRQVLGGMLACLKYQVSFAEDGEKAVQMFRENSYDLILMDVQMPRMDGMEATRAIRRLERESGSGRCIPIVAMTAHAMKEDETRCIESGMTAYLSKPIDFKLCIRTLNELLETERRRESSEPVAT